jgi:prefoldin subunit 5
MDNIARENRGLRSTVEIIQSTMNEMNQEMSNLKESLAEGERIKL